MLISVVVTSMMFERSVSKLRASSGAASNTSATSTVSKESREDAFFTGFTGSGEIVSGSGCLS